MPEEMHMARCPGLVYLSLKHVRKKDAMRRREGDIHLYGCKDGND